MMSSYCECQHDPAAIVVAGVPTCCRSDHPLVPGTGDQPCAWCGELTADWDVDLNLPLCADRTCRAEYTFADRPSWK